MSQEKDCIFCKIVNGDIPSSKVYEDEAVYAFLDISQVTKGHTLIVPKKHTQNIYETDEETAGELFKRVPKIATALKKALNPVGINLLNNNEEAAGQSVFHLHLHLIPRYDSTDGFNPNWETHADNYTPEKLTEIAENVSKNIESN
ncbi:HIT family protein [Saliterribacillus persicus]|uniref:Histidine triad (HIT) family protein n=1 Tax=Saliterribacillus persicus TaxID=930114 RepID=A0A368XUF8_9BACI|nr:HIT family protein [Saliterribacillus persicus]RCW69664.1 histidine triad (HIT) family protein [Saliterribacillus persicus]